jgi:anti-anti-sigma factor
MLRPSGELDMSTVDRMARSLRDALAAGPAELVLDLHELDFCDAAGLRVFLSARRAGFASGTALWLERPTHLVRRLLEVSGLAWLVDDSATLRRMISSSAGMRANGGHRGGGHGRKGFRAVDDDDVVAELEGVELRGEQGRPGEMTRA